MDSERVAAVLKSVLEDEQVGLMPWGDNQVVYAARKFARIFVTADDSFNFEAFFKAAGLDGTPNGWKK